MKDPAAQKPYLFDEFRLDPSRRVLLRGGLPVALNPKALELLLALVEHRAEVLTKDELLGAVWPDQIVEENNLTVHVSALRKALGEKKGDGRFIVTVPGRGYSFVADVRRDAPDEAVVVARHTLTRITVEDDGAAVGREVATAARGSRVALAVVAALLVAFGFLVAVRDFGARDGAARFERFGARRQTSTGKVLAAALSPDGNYIAYAQAEPEGQSLWVKHVAGVGPVRIAEPKAAEYWGLTFTPDGHHVYATTFERSQADPVLSKIPVHGGATERLPVVTNAAVTFSPDGRRIAYVVSSSSSGGSILWTADPDGSAKKFVALRKDPNPFAFMGATVAWSPDGETIACAVINNGDEGLHMTVTGYDARGGGERSLTARRWNIVNSVAWARGGLLVTGEAAQGSPSQVWFVSSEGDARSVTNDLNSYSGVSVARDGRSLVTVQTDTTSGIWTGQAGADAKAGDFRQGVADFKQEFTDFKQEFAEVGEISAVGWNTDGRLAYLSSASGAPELWTLDRASGRARQLTTDSRASDFAPAPDGRYCIVSNRAGRPNLWRADADGSGMTQLTDGAGEVRPRFAADGRSVFFQKGFGDVRSSVWRVPLDGGEARPLTRPHQSFPDISPDGTRLVYSYMDTSANSAGAWRLGVASAADGARTDSFALPASVTNRLARWTPDGQGVVFISTVGGVSNLWLQPIAGGAPHRLTDFTTHQISAFDLARDGRTLAVVRTLRTSDAVLLKTED
ncbi:MAG TPA: winged helix-turn-helix domain-containing protein [Pyrinomonadaceae bacterium]|nr:winged helix-turn-helix domain-containing protein [Pyrinomonadaceae bacterium]